VNEVDSRKYDIVIVGARVAGAALAIRVARAGASVLMVDRRQRGSDTLSSHLIHPRGVIALRELDLTEVHEQSAPELTRVTVQAEDVTIVSSIGTTDDSVPAICLRRTVLDDLMVEAAQSAGTDVWFRTRLTDIEWDNNRVVGARLGCEDGSERLVGCEMLVGADGRTSRVATLVGSATYENVPSLTCAAYSYWEGLPESTGYQLCTWPGFGVGVLPTNDGLTCVIGSWPAAQANAVRRDPGEALGSAMRRAFNRSVDLSRAKRVERYRIATNLDNYFRVPAGPGWALVGDAAHALDPISAQGISNALDDAELCTSLILANGSDEPDEWAAFQQARDRRVGPMHTHTIEMARLQPLATESRVFLRMVSESPRHSSRYVGLISGQTSFDDFYCDPEILAMMDEAASVVQ